MNKILISIVLALIIIGSTFLYGKNKQISFLTSQVIAQKRERLSIETKFKNFILLQSSIANKSIKDLLFVNPGLDTTDFKAIIGNSEKLFFRFTQANCSSCIEEELKNLCNFIPHEFEKDVILITSYNTRVLKLILKTYNMNFSIFTLPPNKNDFLSGSLLPFYFVCNRDGIIVNSFVPDKTNPEMTKLFLHEFKKKKLIKP